MKSIDIKSLLNSPVGAETKVQITDSLQNLDLLAGVIGKNLEGEIKITKMEDFLLVRGKINCDLRLICDRCLEEFCQKTPLQLESCYYIDRKAYPKEELTVDKYGQIDLTEAIREEIILNTSLKNLCKSDCLGICPKCGENKNSGKCQCK